MAIFGKPVARQQYGIQPYMDDLNQPQEYTGPVVDPRPGAMFAAQSKAMQPKAFEKGGKGWQTLGIIGDALQVAGGGRATYADAQRWWEEQEAERVARQEAMAERERARQESLSQPQLANLGRGGLATWSANGGLNVIREPEREDPTYAAYAGMFGEPGTPEYMRAAQDYVLKGAGPTALDGRIQYKQTAPGKAASGGVSATARAKLIAEADRAIAAGADPAAVSARLQKMGVSF